MNVYDRLKRECAADPQLQPTAKFRLLALCLDATKWLERVSAEIEEGAGDLTGDRARERLRLTMGRKSLQRSETSTGARLIGFHGSRHRAALHAAVVELDAIAHNISENLITWVEFGSSFKSVYEYPILDPATRSPPALNPRVVSMVESMGSQLKLTDREKVVLSHVLTCLTTAGGGGEQHGGDPRRKPAATIGATIQAEMV